MIRPLPFAFSPALAAGALLLSLAPGCSKNTKTEGASAPAQAPSSSQSAVAGDSAAKAGSGSQETSPQADAECLEMVQAASALLEGLSSAERASARFSWADEQRQRFEFFPPQMEERGGLSLKGLEPGKRALFDALLSAAMSASGERKVAQIMALEALLGKPPYRDPENYFVSVFGTPNSGNQQPWGFRFEGHHVSLHVSMLGCQTYASTPLFLGTNPRTDPLQREIDTAAALLASLDEGLRQQVAGTSESRGMDSKTARITPYGDRGVAAAQMNAAQKGMLRSLVNLWIDTMAKPIAQEHRRAIEEADFDRVRFMVAGQAFRVQGPTFLIELNYAGPGHAHSVWRDFDGDWGVDLLQRHLEAHHQEGAGGVHSQHAVPSGHVAH